MYKIKKAYICSPLSAPTQKEISQNVEGARWYMRVISEKYHCRAVAPHAFLPKFLDDNDTAERNLGLAFGLAYLSTCDMLVVCGSQITAGMIKEVIYAVEHGILIVCSKLEYSPYKKTGYISTTKYEEI